MAAGSNFVGHVKGLPTVLWQEIAAFGKIADENSLCCANRWMSTYLLPNPAVKSVRLSLRRSATDEIMTAIVRRYTRLDYLSLSSCHELTPKAVQILTTHPSLPLRTLHLPTYQAITDDGVRSLVQAFPQLNVVSLPRCSKLTDEAIKAIARPALQILALSCSTKITDVSMIAIVNGSPQLQGLRVTRCNITNRGVIALAEKLDQLTFLNLNGCPMLTGLSVTAIAKGLPRLKSLGLSAYDSLTDDEARALVQGCSRLQGFMVATSDDLTDVGLQAMARGWPQLQILDLHGASDTLPGDDIEQSSDVTIAALAKGCPQLEILSIPYRRLTKEAIFTSLTQLHRLRKLSLPLSSLDYNEHPISRDVTQRSIQEAFPRCEVLM